MVTVANVIRFPGIFWIREAADLTIFRPYPVIPNFPYFSGRFAAL
jgi:hypothetical protein